MCIVVCCAVMKIKVYTIPISIRRLVSTVVYNSALVFTGCNKDIIRYSLIAFQMLPIGQQKHWKLIHQQLIV